MTETAGVTDDDIRDGAVDVEAVDFDSRAKEAVRSAE